jgi:LPXTG-motif cell wall-anchored protein
MAWRKVRIPAAVVAGARESASRKVVLTRMRVGAVALAAIGAIGVIVAATTAYADPAPAPRFVAGNVATCAAAGLTGDILFGTDKSNADAGSGTLSGDGITLSVTVNAGFTASGIVAKGGDNANVYDGPFVGLITITGLVSPPVGQNTLTPQVSHWFVCGGGATPPTTTPPATTPPATTTPPTTTTMTTTGGSSETTGGGLGNGSGTPSSGGAAGVGGGGGGSLPTTGVALGGVLLAGLALVGGGVGLVMLRRRRDAAAAPVDVPPVDEP